MGKRFFSRRPIEELATNGLNDQARDIQKEILESFMPGRGSCDICVFYRNEPRLYCLRQRQCYPETRDLWRKRVEGKRYKSIQSNKVLARNF